MAEEHYGLSVEWVSTQEAEEPKPAGLDLVVIHGLYGGGIQKLSPGANPGSGSSAWAGDYIKTLETDCRLLLFRYDANQLLSGIRSRDAIRQQAKCLLGQLAIERQTDVKRSIVFVAHDVGGLIIKYALYLAMVHGEEWAEISAYARMLIFSGCLHRSLGRSDMHDRLSSFIFGSYKPGWLGTSPTQALISSLADAVIEINGHFVESKTYLRSYMLSVHAHDSLPGDICHAFDCFAGTLGYAFETVLAETHSTNDIATRITSYLADQSKYIAPLEPAVLDRENLFMSLSPPLDPFTSGPRPEDPLLQVKAVAEWLKSPRDRILYVHGTHDMRHTGEQLFYAIQNINGGYKNNLHMTLYFSFDAYDIRRDSLSAMLESLWTQVVCHQAENVKQLTETVMIQIKEECCWTEGDLIRWFRTLQYWAPIENISLIISGMEKCSKPSYPNLLEMLSNMAFGCDFVSRIAVTASDALDISRGPSTWQCVDLNEEVVDASIGYAIHMGLANITPTDTVAEMIKSIAGDDVLGLHILSEQLRMNQKWARSETNLSHLFANRPDTTSILEFIVSQLLSSYENQAMIQTILTWAIYAARPLSIWEMKDAISGSIGTQMNGIDYERIVSLVTSVFAGILVIEHNEIRIVNRRLRAMFTDMASDSGKRYLWHELGHTADFTIAKTCLEYLCLPDVQKEIQDKLETRSSGSVELPHYRQRDSLCLYAVQMWPLHFGKLSDASHLLDSLLQSDLGQLWAGAFWSISNPITRRPERINSVYPVFAGLDLAHLLEPVNSDNVNHGIVEAARCGQSTTVIALLEHPVYPVSASVLLDTILAAVAGGYETVALQLLERFTIGDSKWPPALLYRAAWLDMPRLAERLLQMGCPPEPGGPLESEGKIIPLRTAATVDSVDTMLVLLKYGADIYYRGLGGKSVLHYCHRFSRQRTARELVARQPNLLELQDEHGDTAVAYCVYWGMYAMLECLLELGGDPTMKVSSERRDSPLRAASRLGQQECVRILLQRTVDPDDAGQGQSATPLLFAAMYGHVEICRLLLEHGADPNHPSIEPPILNRIIRENAPQITPTIVNLLLDEGCQVNAREKDGQTALFDAVRSHRLPLVQCLLDRGAEINIWAGAWSPLFDSMEAGGEICKLLIEKGADIDTPNSNGMTALMLAVAHDHADIVGLLLARNVAVDDVLPDSGYTALLLAAANGNEEITRMLMDAGANAKHQTNKGFGPVHLAVETGSLRALLEYSKRIDLDHKLTSGDTPLIRSLQSPPAPLDNIKLLINAGPDLNAESKSGYTALCMAVVENHLSALSLLLKQPHLDMNAGTSWNNGAPLNAACRARNMEIIERLVQCNANVNHAVRAKAGTPLQSACLVSTEEDCDNAMEVLQYLLDHGADLNRVGGMYGTVLNVAALYCRPAIITFLLEKGADSNKCDDKDACPAHHAASHGIDSLVTILEAGADPSARDIMGRTPLHWAAQGGRVRAVEHLLNILGPGNVNTPDHHGWTPLCWAARAYDDEESPSLAGDPWNQLGVIQLLLRSGATLSAEAKIWEDIWSPLQIACNSRASVDVIKALKPSDQPVLKADIRFGGHGSVRCDVCYWSIFGSFFHCNQCRDYDHCPKCYVSHEILHPGHEFTERHQDPPPESDTKHIVDELNFAEDKDENSESSSEPEDTFWRGRGRMLFRSATFATDDSSDDELTSV